MRKYFVLLLIISVMAGCRGKSDSETDMEAGVQTPDFSIGSSPCPQGDVLLSVSASATPPKSSSDPDIKYDVTVDVSVTCSGDPVAGAPIIVELWWGEKTNGYTDETGNLRVEKSTTNTGESGAYVHTTLTDNEGNMVAVNTSMVQAKF